VAAPEPLDPDEEGFAVSLELSPDDIANATLTGLGMSSTA
jgi:hypothetical protein